MVIGQWRHALSAWALALVATQVGAEVRAVGTGAFPVGSLLVRLDGLADGDEVNGLSDGGLDFFYSLGNGHVIVDGGPGETNHIQPQNLVSIGDPSGVLSVHLPGPSLLFGFGYALLATGRVVDGTTMALFSGDAAVGSLSYIARPDPFFPGGFAGIRSTLPFDRVELRFNPVAMAWAVDNFRVSAVAEPSPLVLLPGGMAVLALLGRRRRQSLT